MSYIAAKCPNCAGNLKLNDTFENGYCVHCNTPVYFKDDVLKVKIIGSVQAPGVPQLNTLIKLIKKDLESGRNQTKGFKNRLKRALELDPDNQFLCNLHYLKYGTLQ